MPDLLIELFSEEIPARMQSRAAEDLKSIVTNGLVEAGLTYASAGAFSTPRRLTLSIDGLLGHSPATSEERKGPRVDAPEKALDGFLRGAGLTRDDLTVVEDKKGAFYVAKINKPGRSAHAIIAEVLEGAIRNFPWPKSMRWGAGSLNWVRPLHSILCITSDEAGAEIVPLSVDGITAGNTTRGHRFMAPGKITVSGFEDYQSKLARAHVVLNVADRAATIWNDAQNQAFALGLDVVEDAGLLAEVAGLVEWPVVLMGQIGEDFLGLPPEVLQTSMREHQKFFSVRNPKSGRIERFITVANVETRDNGATILAGNQKVLAARLSDAKFFWENDLRMIKAGGLQAMAAGLDNVTFHNKLGSQSARIDRIADLAGFIAPLTGADAETAVLAAKVVKADLRSQMVGEFPELQGLMGGYYAAASGLDASIGAACGEHYAPQGPSDKVPSAPVSVAVALADKIDTLTGFWAIDEKPTGSKDPFALRRAALGVIRLILENNLRISLLDVFAKGYAGNDGADLLGFFHDRLKVYLKDQGLRHDVIDACLAQGASDDLAPLVARAQALGAVLKSDDGANLLQAYKRAANILSQAETRDGVEYSYGADVKFAEVDEERALFVALDGAEGAISSAIEAEDFAAAMQSMAALRAPLDAFFSAVQINAENDIIRRNRLNLLSRIRKTCAQVADLSRIEG